MRSRTEKITFHTWLSSWTTSLRNETKPLNSANLELTMLSKHVSWTSLLKLTKNSCSRGWLNWKIKPCSMKECWVKATRKKRECITRYSKNRNESETWRGCWVKRESRVNTKTWSLVKWERALTVSVLTFRTFQWYRKSKGQCWFGLKHGWAWRSSLEDSHRKHEIKHASERARILEEK